MAAEFDVRIAEDGLQAWLSAPASACLDEAALRNAIEASGVRWGLIEGAVEQAARQLAANEAVEQLLIARGVAPKQPHGELILASEDVTHAAANEARSARTNYREQHHLRLVRAGDTLATYTPPRAPEAGRSVRGAELPADTRVQDPKPASVGPGVRFEDGCRFVAARDGALDYRAGRSLDVIDHHTQRGNVDLRCGHLDMDGAVTVSGDVNKGFMVNATGAVEIRGVVQAGVVTAGGDVVVRGGVIGLSARHPDETPSRGNLRGSVSAGGDVTVGHASNAVVSAGGTALVTRHCVATQLSATDIRVGGRVVSGGAYAERSVTVRDAGSEDEVPTRLAAGVPLQAVADQAKAAIDQIRCARAYRGQHYRRPGRIKGGKASRAITKATDDATRAALEFRARQRQLLSTATVTIEGTAHPGTIIAIGARTIRLSAPAQRTCFRADPAGPGLLREPQVP